MRDYIGTITRNTCTVLFADGATNTLFAGSSRFAAAVAAIRAEKSADEVRAVLDGKKYVAAWSCGEFIIVDHTVRWTKNPSYEIPRVLAAKLLEFAEDGHPATAFVKFLSLLLENPSKRSVETFFGFIESQGLTIDNDGYVIGYKGVSTSLKDMHTGKFDNSPGQYLKMERNHVDDDPEQACSVGFHFGGWEYASHFGPKMVLVKVNPKDLVCVPNDCSQGKVRVCEYLVLKEVPNETKMNSHYESGFEGVESDEIEEEAEIENEYECEDCGTVCDDNDAYCRGCGADLEEQKDLADERVAEQPVMPTCPCHCPNCGVETVEDAKFCTCCGAALRKG
jgi:hypothetical protein